jgi:hypothetical protein
MTLKDDGTLNLARKNNDVKVKREWFDEAYDDDPPGKVKRIKREQ